MRLRLIRTTQRRLRKVFFGPTDHSMSPLGFMGAQRFESFSWDLKVGLSKQLHSLLYHSVRRGSDGEKARLEWPRLWRGAGGEEVDFERVFAPFATRLSVSIHRLVRGQLLQLLWRRGEGIRSSAEH